jgi:hypothetical protein
MARYDAGHEAAVQLHWVSTQARLVGLLCVGGVKGKESKTQSKYETEFESHIETSLKRTYSDVVKW